MYFRYCQSFFAEGLYFVCGLIKANDGGLIQNLVKMTTTKLLRDDFEIMLPINQVRE